MSIDIISASVIAICTSLFAALLKKNNKEYGLLLALSACVVIMIFTIGELAPFINTVKGFAESKSVNVFYIGTMLKAAAIAIIGQFAANICKDAGENALAFTVELGVRISIMLLSIPLLSEIFDSLEKIMTL